MGTTERRERQRQELRKQILEAARELFATEGYESVTMRRIAEKIEYSPTAIYFHFKDKEALIRELCTTDFLALAFQFQKIARIADPIDRLRRIGLAYLEFALEHPNQYRLMFMTPHPPVEPEEGLLEKGNPEQDAYAFLRATIENARNARLFRPEFGDADQLAQLFWAGMHGVISLHLAKANDPWVPWKPVQTTSKLLLEGLVRGFTCKNTRAAPPSAAKRPKAKR